MIAQGKLQAQRNYDAAGNLIYETDSEGYALKHEYDVFNRRTKTLYPDGSTTEYTWNRLDIARIKDRSGKITEYRYNAARKLESVKDALRTISFGYDAAGRSTSLTDGRGKVTRWQRDIQGRVIGKYTADGVKTFYEYDSAGRQIVRTDALGQKRILAFGKDNQLLAVSYAGGASNTAGLRFTWDAHYDRLREMLDETGVTKYLYAPVGKPGALGIMSVEGPNGDYRLKRDGTGRVEGWSIGEVGEEYGFDALGRVVANRNSLGEFQYDYLGQTRRISGARLANTPIERRYTFEPNTGDRRIKGIANPQAARSYAYTTTEAHIARLIETVGGQSRSWDYQYDMIERLQSAKRNDGQNYEYALDAADNLHYITAPEGIRTYYAGTGNKIEQAPYRHDANGNRIQDATRIYQWDAEDRLIEIGYRDKPGKKTEFKYDGQGRRVAVIEIEGGKRVETRYTWCGARVCAARDGNGQPLAYYHAEGVYRPAAKKKEFYAKDHLGSVRDVLDEKGNLLARYDYDPYGQITNAPQTSPEFGYAGMQYHAPSGLYLTKYRVYDPKDGRWLSRDPIGETPRGLNLYAYVGGNPVALVDPLGLQDVPSDIAGTIGLPGGTTGYECVCTNMLARRKDVQYGNILLNNLGIPAGAGGLYGHWWMMIDTDSDVSNGYEESYGWWPRSGVGGLGQTFSGVPGILNGGDPTRDPDHNATDFNEQFRPKIAGGVSDYATCPEKCLKAADCYRDFAKRYTGNWAWRFGFGQNCHTFQEQGMKECNLER